MGSSGHAEFPAWETNIIFCFIQLILVGLVQLIENRRIETLPSHKQQLRVPHIKK